MKCKQCGSSLYQNAKFCYNCGVEVRENRICVEKTEFGETLGREYYMYFGEYTKCRRNSYQESKIHLRYAYYDSKFYYVKQENYLNFYIWRTNIDGTEPEVITQIKEEEYGGYESSIFVNKAGIFLLAKKNGIVTLFDFNGKKKNSIKQKNEIKEYYICDNRVFLVTYEEYQEKWKTYRAIWLDAETGETQLVYTGDRREYDNDKHEYCIEESSIGAIMGNKKRIILWLEFVGRKYLGNECIEAEAAGWYSYDFEKRKLQSISCSTLPPDQVLQYPEKFQYWWLEDCYHKWTKIAFFDMKRDIMWIMDEDKEFRDYIVLKPKKISSNSEQNSIYNMPVWRVKDFMFKNFDRVYFDGIRGYCAPNYHKFLSYKNDGQQSLIWGHSGHGNCEGFQVVGDYLFLDLEAFGEEQYNLTYEKSEALRRCWMKPYREAYEKMSAEEDRAMENYNLVKNISNVLSQEVKKTIKAGLQETEKIVQVKKKKESQDIPFKLGYWMEFVTYAFDLSENQEFQNANFSKALPADHNWHALRFKGAKGHIEISFNTQKKTLRAGLFILNNPQLYQKLEAQKLYVELLFADMDVEIQWDGVSKAKNVSIFKKNEDVKTGYRTAQAEWFMESACLLKKVAMNVFGE